MWISKECNLLHWLDTWPDIHLVRKFVNIFLETVLLLQPGSHEPWSSTCVKSKSWNLCSCLVFYLFEMITSGTATSMSRHHLLLLSWRMMSGQFAPILWSVSQVLHNGDVLRLSDLFWLVIQPVIRHCQAKFCEHWAVQVASYPTMLMSVFFWH